MVVGNIPEALVRGILAVLVRGILERLGGILELQANLVAVDISAVAVEECTLVEMEVVAAVAVVGMKFVVERILHIPVEIAEHILVAEMVDMLEALPGQGMIVVVVPCSNQMVHNPAAVLVCILAVAVAQLHMIAVVVVDLVVGFVQ